MCHDITKFENVDTEDYCSLNLACKEKTALVSGKGTVNIEVENLKSQTDEYLIRAHASYEPAIHCENN